MIQKPRGTQDIFGIDAKEVSALENVLRNVLEKYNYSEIRTPIFESKELFVRSVGESSDVVSKEMYDFIDKKGREFVLRPEGTAPTVRALIENKLYAPEYLPFKTFYIGPMFRYERPQIGRNRQFHQLGVEVFGPNSVYQDIEILTLALEMSKKLGIGNNVSLDINFLVNGDERKKYIIDLKKYLENFNDLCSDCQKRINLNPLRVLDCKIDGDKFDDAPNMQDYASNQDKQYFNELLEGIKNLNVNVNIDSKLVRGLDYYTGFIFELKYLSDELGSQSTIIAGGRYNNLVLDLNGPSVPAAGFAMGIERMLIILKNKNISLVKDNSIDLYTIALSKKGMQLNLNLIRELRSNGIKVETDFMERSMKSAFKQAEKYNSKWVAILGDKEAETNLITLKNQLINEQVEVKIDDVLNFIKKGE